MDVVKPKPKPKFYRKSLTYSSIIILVILVAGLVFLPQEQNKIERKLLMLGTVQRGELQLVIDGYGILRSNKQTLISTLTSATVKEILLQPGNRVRKDSIILQLSNPELQQEEETMRMTLSQEIANLRRLKLSNQRELLAEKSTLTELDTNMQSVQLRKEAEEVLLERNIISKISYKTTALQLRQIKQSLELQLQRIDQLKKLHQEAINIQQEQINQVKSHYKSIQQKIDHLTVRSGLEGVLQRLPVALGQSLVPGQELALVGSNKDLLALIQVSQAKADQLEVGQKAQINTHREQVSGVVNRIAPEVHDGTIEVEIIFSNGQQISARPELNVTAQIFTTKLQNILFIERPLNVQSHSNSMLFLLEADSNLAQLEQISFGEDAGSYIQIISGANERNRLILSDMTKFRDAKQIRIIN